MRLGRVAAQRFRCGLANRRLHSRLNRLQAAIAQAEAPASLAPGVEAVELNGAAANCEAVRCAKALEAAGLRE